MLSGVCYKMTQGFEGRGDWVEKGRCSPPGHSQVAVEVSAVHMEAHSSPFVFVPVGDFP